MFGEPEKKEKPIFLAPVLYREVGYFLEIRKQYEECQPFFTNSINLVPKDRRARIGRGWARAYTLQYEKALEDIQAILDNDPNDIRAKYCQAHFTYLAGDFEHAYVKNVRGSQIITQPRWFSTGAAMCNETIENCIGDRAGHPLRDYYDVIRTIAMKRAYDLRKGFQVKSKYKKKKKKKTDQMFIQEIGKRKLKMPIIPDDKEDEKCKGSIIESLNELEIEEELYRPTTKSQHQPLQKCTDNIDNYMAEKYLEALYKDKVFLKQLRNDPQLINPNYHGTLKIKALAKQGYKDIWTRQEILRSRKPFYSIKFTEAQLSPASLKRQQQDIMKQQQIIKSNVETGLKELEMAKEYKLTQECIEIANRIKTYIDKTPLKLLPRKETYLKVLYEQIGEAHLDVYRLNEEALDIDNIQRVLFLFGKQTPTKGPIDDSVIKNLQDKFLDVKQEVRNAEMRIRKATTPLEICWLYYELSRHNIDLKKYDLARVYARKCINLTKLLNNWTYAIISSFQICKSFVQQDRRNEAKNELIKTREYSTKAERSDVLAYIKKCLQVVEGVEIAETRGSQIILQREKEITKAVMSEEVKIQISHLFGKMSAIPPNRRMSIMPGVNTANTEKDLFKNTEMELIHFLKKRQTIKPKAHIDDDLKGKIEAEERQQLTEH